MHHRKSRQIFLGMFWIMFCFFSAVLPVQQASAHWLPVTSNFGWRIHPISGEWKFHAGVDLGYDYGTGVSALFDGEVLMAGDYGDGYGNQVLLHHWGNDTYTRYGHLQCVYVNVGDYVEAGSLIGEVGSTGNSTGPHLHLEYAVPDGDGGYTYTDPLCLF